MDGFLFPRPGSTTWLKVLASWRLQIWSMVGECHIWEISILGGFPKMVDTPKMEGENNGTNLLKWRIWGENPPFMETPIFRII